MIQEDLDIQAHEDGFLALKIYAVSADDVIYRSTLWLPRVAAAPLASALRAALTSMIDQPVNVADGRYVVFSGASLGPSDRLHVEVHRPVDAPHGGYDTFSVSAAGAERAAALLDGHGLG